MARAHVGRSRLGVDDAVRCRPVESLMHRLQKQSRQEVLGVTVAQVDREVLDVCIQLMDMLLDRRQEEVRNVRAHTVGQVKALPRRPHSHTVSSGVAPEADNESRLGKEADIPLNHPFLQKTVRRPDELNLVS